MKFVPQTHVFTTNSLDELMELLAEYDKNITRFEIKNPDIYIDYKILIMDKFQTEEYWLQVNIDQKKKEQPDDSRKDNQGTIEEV